VDWEDVGARAKHITPETAIAIDQAVQRVIEETGWGNVYLVIARNKLRWVRIGPSWPVEVQPRID